MAKYTPEEIKERIALVEHWYHTVEVAPGIFTPGSQPSPELLAKLDLPDDCRGLRVLDLGARDGFFSFALEARGAEVHALDHAPPETTGFGVLRDILDSNVTWHTDNVYEISPEKYGEFEIVLCLGLLYHLRNPLLALDRIRAISTNELYIESFVCDASLVGSEHAVPLPLGYPELRDIPVMQFFPQDELNADYSNWWGPNSLCLVRMTESAGFDVLSCAVEGDRAVLKCAVNEQASGQYWRKIESGLVED